MRQALLAVVAVALGGCTIDLDRGGPAERETRSIELDKSEMARVEIRMGVGELNVDGGSAKLMDADFDYSRARKPIVRYDSSSFRAKLTIEEPSSVHTGGHNK